MSLGVVYLQGIILHGGAYCIFRILWYTRIKTHTDKQKQTRQKLKKKNNNLGGFLAETKLSFVELRKSNGKLQ